MSDADTVTQHPIAAFLTARWDELEQRERGKFVIKGLARCKECGQNTSVTETSGCGEDSHVRFEPCGHTMTPKQFMTAFGEPGPDESVLADIASKREIVHLCGRLIDGATVFGIKGEAIAVSVLELLAAPHAQHPEYKETWRP